MAGASRRVGARCVHSRRAEDGGLGIPRPPEGARPCLAAPPLLALASSCPTGPLHSRHSRGLLFCLLQPALARRLVLCWPPRREGHGQTRVASMGSQPGAQGGGRVGVRWAWGALSSNPAKATHTPPGSPLQEPQYVCHLAGQGTRSPTRSWRAGHRMGSPEGS